MSIFEYNNKMLGEMHMDMPGTSKTPATSHLLMTNENFTVSPEDKSQLFHHLMAKLL